MMITRTVVSADFAKMGYNPEARIEIIPERGVYYVFIRRNATDSKEIEIPWEPAEPDRQKLGIEFATRHPKDAILDAIRIHRAAEESR